MNTCFVCGTPLKSLGKDNEKEILKCPNCGLGVTKGLIKPEYFNYHRDEVYEKNENQFRNIFTKIYKNVEKYKSSSKVLDIGSSTGLLLLIFKENGWEVQGIEPSKSAREYAVEKGIPTIEGNFEDTKINGKFNVVTMDHVLEHMADPDIVLEKVNKLLNENGVLIVNVPNFGSLSAKINGANWEYVLPQEHLWHFTQKSMELLMKKHGFNLLSWEAKSGIWDYDNPLLELWQSLDGLKKRFVKNLLTAIPAWFISRLKLGTGLSVIAKKI